MFKEFGPPTFPVAIPQPLHPEQLKLIAYLSGCVLPVSGASQDNTVDVSLLDIVKFLGGPIVFTTGASCEVNADAGIICIDPD